MRELQSKRKSIALDRLEEDRDLQVQNALMLLLQAERDRPNLLPILEKMKDDRTQGDAIEDLRNYVRKRLLPARFHPTLAATQRDRAGR
jgi:hypothetical protein